MLILVTPLAIESEGGSDEDNWLQTTHSMVTLKAFTRGKAAWTGWLTSNKDFNKASKEHG